MNLNRKRKGEELELQMEGISGSSIKRTERGSHGKKSKTYWTIKKEAKNAMKDCVESKSGQKNSSRSELTSKEVRVISRKESAR